MILPPQTGSKVTVNRPTFQLDYLTETILKTQATIHPRKSNCLEKFG